MAMSNKSTNTHSRTRRRRVLALHGKKSNNEITKIQLSNLGFKADQYDLFYLHGPIEERYDDIPEDVRAFVQGPFYSWFYGSYDDHEAFKSSLFRAIIYVYEYIERMGPFDVIYGFSQGSTVAAMVACAHVNADIRNKITSMSCQNNDDENNKIIARGLFDQQPCSCSIITCNVEDPHKFIEALGIPNKNCDLMKTPDPNGIIIPSIHLIGTKDPRQSNSEAMTKVYNYNTDTQLVYYMDGIGHELPYTVRNDANLMKVLHDYVEKHTISNPITLSVIREDKLKGKASKTKTQKNGRRKKRAARLWSCFPKENQTK